MKGVREKNKKAILVVRGRELVKNASERLTREGVDHGIMMSNHWRYDPTNAVQVCSVDTLFSRKQRPPADLIVIDECHHATSKGYHWLLDGYKNAHVLGVTATPYTKKGLRHVADVVVKPTSMSELIDLGFLVPPIYYAPSEPDLEGVKVSKGEYVEKELFGRMSHLTGDIVTHWKRLASDRPSICFAVNVEHSKAIQAAFCEAGVRAGHLDASSSDEERTAMLKDLESGVVQIIVNCGILCTGVDMPKVSAVIMARPTKSYNLYIQSAGRGTRVAEGKKDFLLIDHAGNLKRHGFITHEPEVFLDEAPKKDKIGVLPISTCPACFAVFQSGVKTCPRCGEVVKPDGRKLMTIDGELRKITEDDEDILIRQFIRDKKEVARRKGYRSGWVFYQLKEEFGDGVAQKYMPKRSVPSWVRSQSAR